MQTNTQREVGAETEVSILVDAPVSCPTAIRGGSWLVSELKATLGVPAHKVLARITLKARYRNAKLANVPHSRMSPGVQCMEALDLYRTARKSRADYPLFTYGDEADAAAVFDEDKEYAAMLFSAARARMRRGFRAAASSRTLERLADNPIGVVAL